MSNSVHVDRTGRIEIPSGGLTRSELCRAQSERPRAWLVSVGRIDVGTGSAGANFQTTRVDIEWGHDRAAFSTQIDPDQSFTVVGSFARLFVTAGGGGGGARIAGQIVATLGSGAASFATLSEYVNLPSEIGIGGGTPSVTRDIPRFTRLIQDSGGYRRFPVFPGAPHELPSRTWSFRSPTFIFGQAIQAPNIAIPVHVPQGASQVQLLLMDPIDPNSTYQTVLTYTMALS